MSLQLRLHQLPQRVAPGPLVRRVDEHAVHVEDRAAKARRCIGQATPAGRVADGERAALAGAQLADLVADADPDRAG